MKRMILSLALSSVLFAPITMAESEPVLSEAALEAKLNTHRAALKNFMQQLQNELLTAVSEGGPVEALAVCNKTAPEITDKVSTDSGIQLKRTSLKIRNPSNAADEWEMKVLQDFEQRKAAGEGFKQLQYSEVVEADGKQVLRYMKAIPVMEKCLACHGETIAAPIANKLNEIYPNDQAQNFKLGDIRGAFSTQEVLN
ncbi:DUF3365 domain-containing protein [Candidatus Albibeggiatoa sp. nov. NOAA]|uniref:Tll0287-like domain-containing protein n=1 Tax=Candidatus Albibeggiatoa sp. nov. NOAA TaxID=3162724 RepID=UPI0033032C95|nr:DUF3365 domain-containing protein [Thiotrichaceae bacterium]